MLAAPLILLVTLLLSGVAVFLALGITATTLLTLDGHSLGGIAQTLVDRLNSPTLTAVPFFVIAATFMRRSTMAEALVAAAEAWLGGVRGGLAYVAVAAAALFASISGSSTATALAISTILLPALAARGFPPRFNYGLIGASATLGILLPPSLALIIFGLVAAVPIPKLFLAGLVPAMIQALLFAGWIAFVPRKMPGPPAAEPTGASTGGAPTLPSISRWRATLRALPALAVPTVALGGIYSGIVTLTEAAALAAVTAIVICWITGNARGRVTLEWIADGIASATVILVVVGFAVLLGHWVILTGVPQALIAHLQANEVTALQFLLAMNVIMLVLGMFLDVVSTILITLPIVLPLLEALGIHPLHYAIVVIVNMELAALTPPVGLNLYVMTSVARVSLNEVIAGLLPFLVLLLILLGLVTLFPALSLWLPG